MADGSQYLGRYEIIREIARSNDIVWEGYDPEMGRLVAIKELDTGSSDVASAEGTERFRREARVLAQLAHPNIVSVYDVGQQGNRLFLVMELIGAPTLSQALQSRGSFPNDEVVQLGEQLLEVAQFLHQKNVVHRDIKPQNLFLLPAGTLKVADFGISKALTEKSISEKGQLLGTAQYMAPEQWQCAEVDARTDLWAIGVVLFQMASGVPPFQGDGPVELMRSVCQGDPPLSLIADPGLRRVVARALEKSPSRRFQTAADMRTELAGVRKEATLGPLSAVPVAQVLRPATPVVRAKANPPMLQVSPAGPIPLNPTTGSLLARLVHPKWLIVLFLLAWVIMRGLNSPSEANAPASTAPPHSSDSSAVAPPNDSGSGSTQWSGGTPDPRTLRVQKGADPGPALDSTAATGTSGDGVAADSAAQKTDKGKEFPSSQAPSSGTPETRAKLPSSHPRVGENSLGHTLVEDSPRVSPIASSQKRSSDAPARVGNEPRPNVDGPPPKIGSSDPNQIKPPNGG
jgi:serine/threonine-protein kinase